MPQLIVQVSPHLPPQNSGVGDYAALVGRRMEELDADVACGYVAAGHNAVELPPDGQHIRNITGQCEPRALWCTIEELAATAPLPTGERLGEGPSEPSPGPSEPSPGPSLRGRGNLSVVLHYSGYGFGRNGCPGWLVDALRARPAGRVARVVTYFHELYAVGWPWRRAFWYSSRQRRIAADVARLSDAILTNREQSARWLEEQTRRPVGSVVSVPVSSNVGELNSPARPSEREPIAVCFGSAQFKDCFLQRHAATTASICAAAGVREIVNIGAPSAVRAEPFARQGIHVQQPGYLSASEVSGWLKNARLALLSYFPDYLAKSSSLAAFAAHGIPTVMSDACNRTADGLVPGRHYLCLSEACRLTHDSAAIVDRLDEIGGSLFEWYQGHTCTAHAKAIVAQMGGPIASNVGRAVTC